MKAVIATDVIFIIFVIGLVIGAGLLIYLKWGDAIKQLLEKWASKLNTYEINQNNLNDIFSLAASGKNKFFYFNIPFNTSVWFRVSVPSKSKGEWQVYAQIISGKSCIGSLLDEKYIDIDKPFSILGDNCIFHGEKIRVDVNKRIVGKEEVLDYNMKKVV
jgi:hypothetical protein